VSAPLRIPMPLRVPELASSLGRLVVPRRLAEPWIPLDQAREELATQVIEIAGAGRRAAQGEDRDGVLSAMDSRAWLAAWEQVVRRVAETLARALDTEIVRAAHGVRMPRRQWKRRLVTPPERRAIAARLAAGGDGFVAALRDLDAASGAVRRASVLDRDAHAAWQEALRTAARRLEAAWLALEAAADAERGRWAPEIADVSAWRPSLVPVLAVWIPAAAVVLWLGLVVGGYLPAPAWLAQLLGF
jgi:hypothetical protein